MKKNRKFKRFLKKEIKNLSNKNNQLVHTCRELEEKYDRLERSLRLPQVEFWLEPSFNESTIILRTKMKNKIWDLNGQVILPKDFSRQSLKDALLNIGKSMAVRMSEHFEYVDITGQKTYGIANCYEEHPEYFSRIFI